MDYFAHYNRLVLRARNRVLDGYCERHHILPRCMDGGNNPENLVLLTGEEHYVAHQLLVKMYPKHAGLAVAAIRMARQCSGNKSYGWLRRRRAECLRGVKLPESTVIKVANWHRGKKRSAKARANISAACQGKKRGPHSPEWNAKIAAGRLGCRHSEETRKALSEIKRGKRMSPEACDKMSVSQTKRWALLRAQREENI